MDQFYGESTAGCKRGAADITPITPHCAVTDVGTIDTDALATGHAGAEGEIAVVQCAGSENACLLFPIARKILTGTMHTVAVDRHCPVFGVRVIDNLP